MTQVVIIFLLIVLNGVFAMSEAAVIASRRARLQQLADDGSAGAKSVLKLVENPNRFLSTVQIGITLIGILAGVFGGATIAGSIAEWLQTIPALARYSQSLSLGLVVLVTTYLSLIVGELVPKRLALQNPEKIAIIIARPMGVLSRIAAPLVTFLSASTNLALLLLGVRPSNSPPVTQEEIKMMMQQGIAAGVFEESEHDMIEGVFKLGNRRISTVMTPRTEIIWLDVEDVEEETRRRILENSPSRFPLAKGDLDETLGFVHAKDLLKHSLSGQTLDLRAIAREPLYVPENMPASDLLETFRNSNTQIALVVGEYGGIQGLVTIHDLLEEIVGDIDEPSSVRRADGSWLLDGMLPTDEFKDVLDIKADLPGEPEGFETLGGFMLAQLGRIPKAADAFEWENWHFEVVDMDGNRVDKVLARSNGKSDADNRPQTDPAG